MSEHDKYSDSAGVPWSGRSFQENNFASDRGEADPDLLAELIAFKNGSNNQVAIARKFSEARVLIPLVATLGESGDGAHGHRVDKSAELSIVSVRTPDGQNGLPIFTSVQTMMTWNPSARPVPNTGRTVALAAIAEGNTRVVLDPGTETEFVFRRTALESIAQGIDWQLPNLNSEVIAMVDKALDDVTEVQRFTLLNGDPKASLQGHELSVIIYLAGNVSPERLGDIQKQFLDAISTSSRFVELVDSVGLKFLPAS